MIEAVVRLSRRLGVLPTLLRALRKLGLLVVAFRAYEALQSKIPHAPALESAAGPDDSSGVPLPPSDLMVLVAGTADREWFLTFGAAMFRVIQDALRRDGAEVTRLRSVLEFGCGCGRVLRYWSSVAGPAIHGIDYNEKLVDWCRRHLGFADCRRNRLQPPLPYDDAQFDFVYAISVFTHMSADLQREWMRELRRVLAPGGYLFITTHGESFASKLSPEERAAFDRGQLVVRFEEASGMNLCNAYHPTEFVRHALMEGFEVRQFIPAGTRNAVLQDAYLAAKLRDVAAS